MEPVAQLDYQPKVQIQGEIKFAVATNIASHGHYLTTSQAIISILPQTQLKVICLIILLLTKTGPNFEWIHFKTGLPKCTCVHQKFIKNQECIPVACVPSAAVAVVRGVSVCGGGCLPTWTE